MPGVPHELDLSAPQARVLGCLMEKQVTTPDAYPITLKALTTACNQSSNRHPVVDYEPTLVEATVHALKGKGLARVVHPARGERATKYRHVADDALGLDPGEAAVVSVLLLRGAQTLSELRTRTGRMHHFGSPSEVEAVLGGLSGRVDPLVAAVERQSGQKEQRWIQLLESDPEGRAAAAPAPGTVAPRARDQDAAAIGELARRVEELEHRVSVLTEALGDLADPPATDDPG